jgi:hypothetical protein
MILSMRWLFFIIAALLVNTAFADSYTSPSGYLEIIGYKLQRTQHDGTTEISVSGSAMALADCDGAIMLFNVMDRNGNQVGTYKIIHGEFFRHDGWALGPGTFTPLSGDSQQAAAAADHITVRQIECTRRR